MRLPKELLAAGIILAVIIYAGNCSGQPTQVTRHYGLADESSKVALLSKVDETLHNATSASAAAAAQIATKVDRQTALLSKVDETLRNATAAVAAAAAQIATQVDRQAALLSKVSETLHNASAAAAAAAAQSATQVDRQTALLSKVSETLHNATTAVAAAVGQVSTKVDRQTAISVMTQSHVQQLSSIVGRLLTGSSNLSTAAAWSTGGLQQAVQVLTEVSTHMSTRIEKLHDIVNITLMTAEVEGRIHTEDMLSNLSVALRGAYELQNETTQCIRADRLLSQYNESFAILQRLPDFMQSVILTTYQNASVHMLNHALRSFTGFDFALNQSQRGMRELSVNYNRSVDKILSLVSSTTNNSYQYRELMSYVSLQNERFLKNVERIFFLFDNISTTMQGIQQYGFSGANVSDEKSAENFCSPYDEAQRAAKINSLNAGQQWAKKIVEMQVVSEYLSPAASRIIQGSVTYTGCQDAFRRGMRNSDVHNIGFPGTVPFRAWCDFDSRGGWMVMQRRFDGTVDFFKRWTDYVIGFGNLWGEHWLGLDKMHQLTRNAVWLSIYMEAFDATAAWANYSSFRVGNVSSSYRMSIGGYSGTAGDSFSYHNGQSFSTWDRDNDAYSDNCAHMYFGAWWYAGCHQSNLNGRYERETTGPSGTSNKWASFNYGLKVTVMRILV